MRWDWSLINPFSRSNPKEKEEKAKKKDKTAEAAEETEGTDEPKKKKKKKREPMSPTTQQYLMRAITATGIFLVLSGIVIAVFFRNASVQVLFGALAVMLFLLTVVFGAALYVALGALERTMLKKKAMEEEQGLLQPEAGEQMAGDDQKKDGA